MVQLRLIVSFTYGLLKSIRVVIFSRNPEGTPFIKESMCTQILGLSFPCFAVVWWLLRGCDAEKRYAMVELEEL